MLKIRESKIKIKKNAICFFLLLIFVIPCYSQKDDVLGWQDAYWGMSEKDLQDTFKSRLKKLPKREIFVQAYVDYIIQDYEIEGRKYTVYFQMSNETNKLVQVLVRDNVIKSSFPQNIYFSELESLFIAKYGTADYKKNDRESYLISLQRRWEFPTSVIELDYTWIDTNDLNLLTIRYFPTKNDDLKSALVDQNLKKSLDGFWGMTFGSSMAECKKNILAKEGATIDNKNSSETVLIIDGAIFGGRKTDFISLEFITNKLHTARVFYPKTLEAKVEELYSEIKSEINSKYYTTKVDFRNFKSPYRDGDGYDTQAIRLGKGTVAAFWKFKRSDEFENLISLEIKEDLIVSLSYQDGKLIKEAVQKRKSESSKDY